MSRKIAGGEREGTVVGERIEPKPEEIHLTHQLVSQAEIEVGVSQLAERLEGSAAGGADNGIDTTDAAKERTDRLRLRDVDAFW